MGKLRSLFQRRRPRASTSAGGGDSESPSTELSPTSASAAAAREEMERVFTKFDSNGDGKISSSELAAIFESLGQRLSAEELTRMMNEADTDGDGFVSLEEFVDLNVSTVDPIAVLEDLRHAFSIFDLDHNGKISAEELARVMRGLGDKVSLAQCRKMIESVDTDGDGLVNFEEFKVMMFKSPFISAIANAD